MHRTIHKYNLSATNGEITMPKGAETIAVQEQNGSICLWAIVDLNQPAEVRTFLTVGTGQRLPKSGLAHIGTVQEGGFVWHVFEVRS